MAARKKKDENGSEDDKSQDQTQAKSQDQSGDENGDNQQTMATHSERAKTQTQLQKSDTKAQMSGDDVAQKLQEFGSSLDDMIEDFGELVQNSPSDDHIDRAQTRLKEARRQMDNYLAANNYKRP